MDRDSAELLDDRPPPPGERIAYGPEQLQFGDLRLPSGPGPHPLVVMVHGGSWMANHNLVHASHLCAALAGAGIASWNVEYRRYGDPGGGWPGTLGDVELALAHVPALPAVDRGSIVLAGHSAGGHLALLAARSAPFPLRGVLALAPVAEPEAWDSDAVALFFGGPPPPEGSPRQLLPLGVRHVLVHGTDDETVPFAMAAAYVEAAGGEAELLTLEGTGHLEPIDPQAAVWPRILAAFRSLLDG